MQRRKSTQLWGFQPKLSKKSSRYKNFVATCWRLGAWVVSVLSVDNGGDEKWYKLVLARETFHMLERIGAQLRDGGVEEEAAKTEQAPQGLGVIMSVLRDREQELVQQTWTSQA
jgi:hypothetical protein